MDMSPEEMINSFLQNPDAINKIGSLLGAMGGEDSSEKESSSPFDNPETIFKITSILSSLSGGDDNETRLIEALKPYLSQKRSESADKAIKIMKLSKMAPLLGDLNIF